MTSRPNIDALRIQIRNNRCLAIDKRPFVPESSLRLIFTAHAIAQAVAELNCQPEDRIGLEDAIQLKGITTFAILIWMRQEDAIVDFRRRDCLDSNRLSQETALIIAPSFGQEFAGDYSWQFRPHFFHIGEHLEIDEHKILPFLQDLGDPEEGGFGLVSKVEVHPLLQDFYPGSTKPVVIIRKAIHKEGSDARRQALFDNEKRMLLLLNSRKHPNLTPFYGAYKYGRELCFLFPVLAMDLRRFFQRDRCYGDFQWDCTFVAALCGLSSALSCVHDICLRRETEGVDFIGLGYHHDLRPANILVTRETFVLADFGLGRLKADGQDSQTQWKSGAGDYLAPECMNENLVRQDVGRAIDVWAFGCLVAEVIIFMRMGSQGLEDFCKARLSPGYFANQTTSYFHDNGRNMKDCIRHWFENLLDDHRRSSLDKLLHNLVFDILLPLPKRPTISDIFFRLSLLNTKAHYDDVLECFNKIVEDIKSNSSKPGVSMKVWFERERLKAFGTVLGLDSLEWNSQPSDTARLQNNEGSIILKHLLKILHSFSQIKLLEEDDFRTKHVSPETKNPPSEIIWQTDAETLTSFADDVQKSVQQLWELLPRVKLKRVESVWVSSMLELDKVDQLSSLEQTLRSEEPMVYQEGAAVAMMKQIRLQLSADTNAEACQKHKITGMALSQNDIKEQQSVLGHQIGLYKGTPVIVEWMYYDASWKKIPIQERILSMSLKAKGFDVMPKPDSLRTLHCLGFYEQLTEQRCGYGFVYEIPRPEIGLDPTPVQFLTLNSLLKRSVTSRADPNLNQPLLGDKYLLASRLADFIEEFHTIGWLHENLHSNNIIFFHHLPDGYCIGPANSKMITDPHILGLHKCRPGGEKWHTQGPVRAVDFLGYAHPAYELTRHFRYGYDYYTLGLVLLEIGLWTPLQVWLIKNKGLKPDQFRDLLIKTYVPRLGPKMGSVYQEIVHKLLADGLDSIPEKRKPDSANERLVSNKFIEEVAEPLDTLTRIPL